MLTGVDGDHLAPCKGRFALALKVELRELPGWWHVRGVESGGLRESVEAPWCLPHNLALCISSLRPFFSSDAGKGEAIYC